MCLRALLIGLVLGLPLPAAAEVTGRPEHLPPWLGAKARELVAAGFSAPATTNFRKLGAFRLSDGGWAVCGEVDARNRFGLATGWRPLYLRLAPSGPSHCRLARKIVDWPAGWACRQLAMGRALRTLR